MPYTVLRQVAQSVSDLGLSGARLVVAASGGVDSSVLAHALHEIAPDQGLALSLAHIHHGLRGDEADADETRVAELAEELGVPFLCERIDPGAAREGQSSRDRPTIQEAARQLRYRALEGFRSALQARAVVTAHNADDQAETVLLRLLRGCGPDGLAGIRELSRGGSLARPLLRVSRAEILAYAETTRLSWREDASNLDTHYARNRLRHHWLPGLASDFNPQLLRTIGNLAEAQQRDSEWIGSLVEAEAARIFDRREESLWIEPARWRSLPDGLTRRLIVHALCEFGAGREVTRVHLERVSTFLTALPGTNGHRGGRTLELPGGVRVSRERGLLRIYRVEVKPHARLDRE